MKEIEALLENGGVTLLSGAQYSVKDSVYKNLIVDVYKNKNVLIISDEYKDKNALVSKLIRVEHADTEIKEEYPNLDIVCATQMDEVSDAFVKKSYDFVVLDTVNALEGDIIGLLDSIVDLVKDTTTMVLYDSTPDYKRDEILLYAKKEETKIRNVLFFDEVDENPFESVKEISITFFKKDGNPYKEKLTYPFGASYCKIFEMKQKKKNEEEEIIGFDKIAGYQEVKDELLLIKSWWENKDSLIAEGIDLPHSILLRGPMGTGKSLFAREFAALFPDATIVKIDGNHSFSMDEITEKFEYARTLDKMVIILIDEIDYVAKISSRELLTQMDGLGGDNTNIFVIATCNDTDSMNPALLRRGRLDYIIGLGNPNMEERKSLFTYYFNKYKMDLDYDLDYLATITKGENAVNIKGIVNEARLRYGVKPTLDQLETCIDKINKRDLSYFGDNEDHNDFMTAVHEVSHAVLAYQYPKLFSFYKATLESNSLAGGLCKVFPTTENPGSAERSIADIEISLAGFLGCKVLYGYIDRGAQSDLDRARNQAASLVNIYGYRGFDALLATSRNARPTSPFRKFINERRSAKILKECEKRVTGIIKTNKDAIISLANLLVKNKTITRSDLDQALKK